MALATGIGCSFAVSLGTFVGIGLAFARALGNAIPLAIGIAVGLGAGSYGVYRMVMGVYR